MKPDAESLQAVDAFLAGSKRLAAEMPVWKVVEYDERWVLNWQIVEADGAERSKLCFHVPIWRRAEPTCTLVFRGTAVTQLDLAPQSVRKKNPPGAAKVNAPAHVDGNHWHPWRLNRQHILRSGRWELPNREAIPPTFYKVSQALIWLAKEVGIALESHHYAFEGPRKTDFFTGDAP